MESKTILVVEDRVTWRENLCEWLEFHGYRVLQASCAEEFKQQVDDADLVLLDISIPERHDGPEVSTAGLDALLELQGQRRGSGVLERTIIRSMWNRDLFGQRYQSLIARIPLHRWRSREVPVAELHQLIKETLKAGTNLSTGQPPQP